MLKFEAIVPCRRKTDDILVTNFHVAKHAHYCSNFRPAPFESASETLQDMMFCYIIWGTAPLTAWVISSREVWQLVSYFPWSFGCKFKILMEDSPFCTIHFVSACCAAVTFLRRRSQSLLPLHQDTAVRLSAIAGRCLLNTGKSHFHCDYHKKPKKKLEVEIVQDFQNTLVKTTFY